MEDMYASIHVKMGLPRARDIIDISFRRKDEDSLRGKVGDECDI
jgi:hypothetical protein